MMDDETTIVSSNSQCDEAEDSDEWDEMDTAGEQTICLFCPLQFLTIAVAMDHCRTEHNFDLLELKSKFQMDCYSYIKMINYIRQTKCEAAVIVNAKHVLWDNDSYLKPGELETWLMYDFDDLGTAPSTPHYAIDGKTPLSSISYSDLQRKINDLERELKEKCYLLETAQNQILEMKKITKTIIEGTTCKSTPTTCSLAGGSDYFHSYSHFGIHHEMLSDKIRTESYRDAIYKNAALFKDKIVLDVGCGTGILSMFAAHAGAQKVYAIDESNVVYKAMDIIRENKLDDKIELIKGQVERIKLPVDKVDVIISEWMGYFLLFEGMLDTFIYARDKYLNPDGMVLPNKCNISLIGVSDQESYNKYINFWDDVYGFSMKCMKEEVLSEAFVNTVENEKLLTEAQVLISIDLEKCEVDVCNFSSNFSLTVTKNGILTALIGYFDITFGLETIVHFSTGPETQSTHWQQTVFYLKNTFEVKKGEVIEGSLSCSRLEKNLRGLLITITLKGNSYKYVMD